MKCSIYFDLVGLLELCPLANRECGSDGHWDSVMTSPVRLAVVQSTPAGGRVQ